MRDLGNRTEDSTVDFTFHTTNTSAAPTTLAGSPVISVYKANGTTQSIAGVTLTVDFDSVTGLNHVRIDLSADAFYTTANDYSIVITTGTVGGVSVAGATVATFSIENRFDKVDVLKLGGSAQSLTDLKDFADSGYDPATKKVQGVVLVDTLTTYTGNTPQTGNSYLIVNHASYGNAQLVRSTTPTNTFDISATGEGGLDFNNIKNAASPHTLTNITVPNVTLVATVTNVTGTVNANAVSAIASFFEDWFTVNSGKISGDEISGSVILEIAKVVWDRILNGANHNINGSGGKRLRQIQENLGYVGGYIWVDTVNGTSGTVEFENGTLGNPVDNLADANTLAASLNINRFYLLPGSLVDFVSNQIGQQFDGCNWTLVLSNISISGTGINDANVSGIATGAIEPQFRRCHFGDITLPPSHFDFCGLEGTFTVGSAGDFFFDDCKSGIAGNIAPTFDFGAALNSSNINFRRYSGGLHLHNMGAGTGTYNVSLEGDGQLIINTNCSATSVIAVRGNFEKTNNASGITLFEDARYDITQILDQVNVGLNTAIPELGVAQPTATPSVRTALMLPYMALRNQLITQTSGIDALEVYNDAGLKITSKLLTDNGSDYTEAQMS